MMLSLFLAQLSILFLIIYVSFNHNVSTILPFRGGRGRRGRERWGGGREGWEEDRSKEGRRESEREDPESINLRNITKLLTLHTSRPLTSQSRAALCSAASRIYI